MLSAAVIGIAVLGAVVLWAATGWLWAPPWSVEELNDACFVVRDHNGQQLAYVYFEEEPGAFNTTAMSNTLERTRR